VQFLNGSLQRVHFFASRLKYSRHIRVSLVPNETVEPLVRTLAGHLQDWGGRPLLCVFDRPKTIALKWEKNGEVTEWNPVFAEATLEMGIGVELCWPYQARQKGSVENLVGFVKSSFFKVRKFYDEEDLRQQLAQWHHEVNEERPCRATGIIPAVRLGEEAPRLRPLRVRPEELALRIPVYVGPNQIQIRGITEAIPCPRSVKNVFWILAFAEEKEDLQADSPGLAPPLTLSKNEYSRRRLGNPQWLFPPPRQRLGTA